MTVKFFLFLFSFFWFLRQIKAILFWLYLWQLKEYHIGRFGDHFRTYKGKKIFLNKVFISKILLFLPLIFLREKIYFYFLFLFSYFLESLKFLFDLFLKKTILPKFTLKIILLFFFNLFFVFFYFFSNLKFHFYFLFYLVLFDILNFGTISALVLIFQIPTALFKRIIIEKAKQKRKKFKDLLVIAIVGSYGKTSTKEFLAEILSQKYKVLKTKEHQNSEIGISKCILNNLKPEHQIFVVEMGAYNKGGIKLLCEIAKPKIGIITGVNEQHLALFGSMENLISAEGGKELIESLPENGLVIFNGNNRYCQELYQKTKILKRIVYSTFSTTVKNIEYDLTAENIKVEKEYLFFTITSKDGEKADFKVNLLGAQNIENVLLAACCAKELGMSLKEISQASEKLKSLPHQMELKKGINNLNIIDATYSANPDGVFSHLEYLKVWSGKKVIVMPCLIELGKASKKIHKKIGEKIAEVCDLAIITTKDKLKEIRDEAIKNGMRKENILFLETPEEIFEKIKNFCQKEDVILLEGRVPDQLMKLLEKK